MESIRQSKVARLLQRELGDMFLVDAKTNYDGAMITVTTVRISSDLSSARVYLSLYATKDKPALLAKINSNSREIRHHLGSRIRKQVRIIPELHFMLDDSLDYIDRIDELLHQ